MSTTSGVDRYTRLSIALHWLMLALMVVGYTCIELRVFFERGSVPREALKSVHFMVGLTILLLVWVRLYARFRWPRPPIRPAPSRLQERLAGLLHVVLYGFMIGMPVAGWLVLSAEGKAIPFYGLELPALIDKAPELGKQIGKVHETVGRIGYALIGLHAAASLWHHFVQRDDTLLRMMPRGRA